MSKRLTFDEIALNSNLLSDSPSLKLLRVIGSPFNDGREPPTDDEESLELYGLAVRNKIPMLYLEALRQQGRLGGLETNYAEGKAKYVAFIKEVARVSEMLDDAGVNFAIYKTIRPYPTLPRDMDIITMGNNDTYLKAAETLLRAKYNVALPGVVDAQTLTNDADYIRAARLATKPTSFKKEHIGPTATHFIETAHNFCVDLHQEIAMNYTVYMDKTNFERYIIRTRLNNRGEIKTLTPELDLACLVAHSLMEQLYSLGEYYSFIFHLSRMDEGSIDKFINIVKENRITSAARVFTTITFGLYQVAHKEIPEKLQTICDRLGSNNSELKSLIKSNFILPHRYKMLTVAGFLLEKMREKRARKGILMQGLHMLNPMLARLVIGELIDKRRRQTY